MRPNLTAVTLGVKDLAAAHQFYTRLGFKAHGDNEGVVFLRLHGLVLALYPRPMLAADAGVPDSPAGFSGITLAHNTRDRAEADQVLAEAVAAGGRLVKPAHPTFWGGYGGYFADPDGHLWEVVHNPHWKLDAAGVVEL